MGSISALAGTTLVQSSQTTTDTTSSSSSSDTSTLEEDKADFLTLLLTQLENQNPLDPMDTDEYTQQLVSYSQLEQQMEINQSLSTISSQLAQSAVSSNLSYIGQTVEVDTNIAVAEDDSAHWAYSIDGTASDVYLTVTDEDGNVFWTGTGDNASGVNALDLDLSDLGVTEGTPLYLSINAQDSQGNSLDSSVSSFVKVDGVQSDGDTMYLTSGGLSFTSDDVLKITA